jgi:hypothetical protein
MKKIFFVALFGYLAIYPSPSFLTPKFKDRYRCSSDSSSSNEKYLFVRLVWELDVAELHKVNLSVLVRANF